MAKLLVCLSLLVVAVNVYGEKQTSIEPSPTAQPLNVSPSTTTTTTSSSNTKAPSFTVLPTVAPLVNYTIYNSSRYPCLMLTGGIQMIVGYNLTAGGSKLVPVAVLNTTNATNATGQCGETVVNITLHGVYPPDNSSLYNITFIMMNDESEKEWNVSNIVVQMNLSNSVIFENNTEAKPRSAMNLTADITQADMFTSLDYTRSYSCMTPMAYNMTIKNGDGSTYNLTLNLAQFQVQAFKFQPVNGTFGNAMQCAADITGSKIVPIAVGAALAGLVLIVIVAYIVGRLRSRQQNSYEALS